VVDESDERPIQPRLPELAGHLGPTPGSVSQSQDYRELLDSAESVLDGVDAALKRLAAGSYARCERCAAEIGEERLSALPTVRTCQAHA
jgi:RNA polymerase-binding transcription factor DksA